MPANSHESRTGSRAKQHLGRFLCDLNDSSVRGGHEAVDGSDARAQRTSIEEMRLAMLIERRDEIFPLTAERTYRRRNAPVHGRSPELWRVDIPAAPKRGSRRNYTLNKVTRICATV